MDDLEAPLQGMRVVEVAGGVPAAYCTHLLAGYGADVVRVEATPDPWWSLDDDERAYLLPGKRIVRIHGPVGAGTGGDGELARLVDAADAVVVDGRPARFDVAAWRTARPELVAVTVAPFGQSGPDRDQPADDLIAFAAGGTMSLTGDPAATPLVSGGAQAMYFAGLHAFSATVAAYLGAVVHGQGDWIDLSLQECLAGALELYGPAAAHGEPAALRFGNYHRAVWAVYPCADGYAGVFCLERQVPALFDLIGEPALQEDRFRDPLQRPDHDEELSAYVLSFMVDRTGDELVRLGAEHRIPFGKVRTPAELIAGPALHERGFFDTVIGPDGMPIPVPGRPFAGLRWQGGGTVAEPGDPAAVLATWGAR
jgi:crotonobetainyl-CoA:carnitine CoA-transferase CaiB-like acyl-CoA transferase